MKKLALVLAFALVACNASSKEDDNTGDTVADVTAGPGQQVTPPTTEVAEPVTDPTLPTLVKPSYPDPKPTETCQTMRDKVSGGDVDIDTEHQVSSDKDFIDVEAFLSDEVLNDAAKSHLYRVKLVLSTVSNASLYASFGGHPMESLSLIIDVSKQSATALDKPWKGKFTGGEGSIEQSTCTNGTFSVSAVDAGMGSTKLFIEESNKDFISGRLEQVDESGASVAHGVFHAPIRKAPKASTPKQGLSPTKALCCKLQ